VLADGETKKARLEVR